MLKLSQVEREVHRLANTINAPEILRPTFGHTEDFARPHIEVNGAEFHYVIVERGKERERHSTSDFNELLFRIFEGITFSMAADYELKNRIISQDFRIILFERQLSLLNQINPDWGDNECAKIKRRLARLIKK